MWITLVVILAPATFAVAHPTSYASSASACQAFRFFLPNVAGCPIRIEQAGSVDALGCAGPEPAVCTVGLTGTATGHGAPAIPRSVRLVLALGPAADGAVEVCSASVVATTDLAVSCTGTQTLAMPLALGACREVRSRAEMHDAVSDVQTLMSQTEVAFNACRSLTGVFTLVRA